MGNLEQIEVVIERLRVASRGGDELVGSAVVWLEIQKYRADTAEAAFLDALRGVPWIDHNGNGDPPKSVPDYVQVRFRDGDTLCGKRWDWDQNWSWSTDFHDGDIVAYRALPTSSPHLAR